jgi:peptidyl-dipeptidase Dcp
VQRRTFLASAAATGAVAAFNPSLSMAQTNASLAANPLTQKWTGPYGGVPAFDKVKVADFKPALEEAMAKNLAEIDAITSNKAKPTFDNTIAALEDSGRALGDVSTYYGIWGSNMSSPEFQVVEAEMDPKLSAHNDKINQNTALFARIEAVYNSPEKAKLTPEQQRVLWIYYRNFVRSGAKLDPAAKARIGAINTELAGLFTKFSQNLLADENTWIELTDADLAGLPEGLKAAAGSNAAARKLPGKFIVVNTRSSVDPFLTESPVRAAREKVWRAFVNRGDNGGATDNNAIIAKILKLRVERAKLLGYKTHAHWRLENAMAKTPENAMGLMEAVWTPAIAQVAIDVADMQAIIDKEGGGLQTGAVGLSLLRREGPPGEVRPRYERGEAVPAAGQAARGHVLGLGPAVRLREFKKLSGIPVYHEDITVYEVTKAASMSACGTSTPMPGPASARAPG